MRCSKLISTIIVLMIGASVTLAQWGAGAVTEENDFGQVNYSERMVRATGIGAVNPNAASVGAARAGAITAARADAYRRLLEAVKGVQINSETTINNSMVENDVVQMRVNGMVTGANQVGDVRYLSDTSVEITLEVPLSGIMDIVLPTEAVVAPAPEGAAAPAPGTSATATPPPPVAPAIAGQPVTGVIIDARGLGVKPSISPQVLAEDGSILYGPGKYPRDFAVTQGVVGYHKDIDAARDDARVAGNPLTIRGLRTSGTQPTNVVISMSDAQRAAGYDGFAEAISNCRVMFILD